MVLCLQLPYTGASMYGSWQFKCIYVINNITNNPSEPLLDFLIISLVNHKHYLLYEINRTVTSHLKPIYTSASHIIQGTNKEKHITVVLHCIHSLPIWYNSWQKIMFYIHKLVTVLIQLPTSYQLKITNYFSCLPFPTNEMKSIVTFSHKLAFKLW